MMVKIFDRFLCVSLLISLYFFSSHTEISLINLRGMTSGITDELTFGQAGSAANPMPPAVLKNCGRFSPAFGAALWNSPFLKNAYLYAPQDDDLHKLMNVLFYIDTNGGFDITHSVTSVGYHLNPVTIGALIGHIALALEYGSDQTLRSGALREFNDHVRGTLNNLLGIEEPAVAKQPKKQKPVKKSSAAKTVPVAEPPAEPKSSVPSAHEAARLALVTNLKLAITEQLKNTNKRLEGDLDRITKAMLDLTNKIAEKRGEYSRLEKSPEEAMGMADKDARLKKLDQEALDLEQTLNKLQENWQRLETGKNINTKYINEEMKAPGIVKNAYLLKSVNNFAEALTGCVRDELDGVYPQDMTTSVLLAFLWKKAEGLEDARHYLDTLANTLGVAPHMLYQWPNDMKDHPYTKKDCDRLASLHFDEGARLDAINLDDLIFVGFGYNLYYGGEDPKEGSQLPLKIDYASGVKFGAFEFPDCGETTLRNFVNALSYNDKEKRFDVETLRKLGFAEEVLDFYQRYPTTETMREKDAHNAWATVVSNKSGVKYQRGGSCEISAGLRNFVTVLANIWPGVNSLGAAKDRVEKVGMDMSILSAHPIEEPVADEYDVNNTIDIKLKKPGFTKAASMTLKLEQQHFDLNFGTGKKLPFADEYRNWLRKFIGRLPLAHMCVYTAVDDQLPAILNAVTALEGSPAALYFCPLDTHERRLWTALALVNVTSSKAAVKALAKILHEIEERMPDANNFEALSQFMTNVAERNKDVAAELFALQSSPTALAAAAHLSLCRSITNWNPSTAVLKTIDSANALRVILTLPPSLSLAGYGPQEAMFYKSFVDWTGKRETLDTIIRDARQGKIPRIFLEELFQKLAAGKPIAPFSASLFGDFGSSEPTSNDELLEQLYDAVRGHEEELAKVIAASPIGLDGLVRILINVWWPRRDEDSRYKFLIKLWTWMLRDENYERLTEENKHAVSSILVKEIKDKQGIDRSRELVGGREESPAFARELFDQLCRGI